ncbi:MAG TPA: hypothetical protein VHR27_21520, partial [Blastocatellia bacterium]|nr:hypothetical protein [Blastocatellia bacterium]
SSQLRRSDIRRMSLLRSWEIYRVTRSINILRLRRSGIKEFAASIKQNHPTGHNQIRPAIVVAGKRGALIDLWSYACDSFPRRNQVRRREKIGISLAIFIVLRNWVID